MVMRTAFELRLDLENRNLITFVKYIIMKKLFSVIALGAMTLSLSSFNENKILNEEEVVDCLTYAQAAMVDEQETYGFEPDRGAYLEGLRFYYDACESTGGNTLDPVFT